jgi:hypothetical protein
MRQEALSSCLKQLAVRPFWADFDLRDKSRVYKTGSAN